MDTRVALLEQKLNHIERDAEKREKLQDARHAETMAALKQLEMTVSAGRDFGRGVSAAAKTAWAVLGATVSGFVMWLITRPGP